MTFVPASDRFRFPVISENFQRMIEKRLRAYFADSSLIDEEQEGFQPKHSTTSSLYRMHRLFEDVKKYNFPSARFNIDLEKAFDSIWIDVLFFKLRKSGVSGKKYDILKTFLKQREAYIVVNNIATDKFHNPVGSPKVAYYHRFHLFSISATFSQKLVLNSNSPMIAQRWSQLPLHKSSHWH